MGVLVFQSNNGCARNCDSVASWDRYTKSNPICVFLQEGERLVQLDWMIVVGPFQLKRSILFLFVADVNQAGFPLPKVQPLSCTFPIPPGAPSCSSAFFWGVEVELRGAVAVEYRAG